MKTTRIEQLSITKNKNNSIKIVVLMFWQIILRLLPFFVLIATFLWLFNTIFPNGFNEIFGTAGTIFKNIGKSITYPTNWVIGKIAKNFPSVSPKFWTVVKTLFTGSLIIGFLKLIVVLTPFTLTPFGWIVIITILAIALWNAFTNDNTSTQTVIDVVKNKTEVINS